VLFETNVMFVLSGQIMQQLLTPQMIVITSLNDFKNIKHRRSEFRSAILVRSMARWILQHPKWAFKPEATNRAPFRQTGLGGSNMLQQLAFKKHLYDVWVMCLNDSSNKKRRI